jgi:hypothetical protein
MIKYLLVSGREGLLQGQRLMDCLYAAGRYQLNKCASERVGGCMYILYSNVSNELTVTTGWDQPKCAGERVGGCTLHHRFDSSSSHCWV